MTDQPPAHKPVGPHAAPVVAGPVSTPKGKRDPKADLVGPWAALAASEADLDGSISSP